MRFEVEQKHPVDDSQAFLARLAEWGVTIEPAATQVDQYFAHPARDFARTDEALRIRTIGSQSFITYKGPKLDAATKTRREIELPLDSQDGDGSQFRELLLALGFSSVAEVRKERRPFLIRRDGVKVVGALDDVHYVGSFVEIEIVTDDAGLEAAKRTIAELAEELGLGPAERRSYLELLLGR
jgi:adenylate cyclase, class 2